jgi:bifunctional UDP-N-acetylglucosamine pyrophosphorylase/glucosamine-1-phosphate N-acetyltransferase
VYVGEGAHIKRGTYIEGPVYIGRGTVVGPNAYLRPGTVVLDRCHIGFGAEIVDTLIMSGTVCKHRAYIGHSVIGERVNVGAGLVTADYRHDGGQISTPVKGEKVETYRTKLGAFIGDDVRLGVHTSIYPGRKLWPGTSTLPGEVVTADKLTAG